MVIVIYFSLFVLSFVITYQLYHSLLKINFIYTTMWCLGAILVSSGYSDLYTISFQVHVYIIVSIIVFNTIYILRNRECKYVFYPKWEITRVSYQIIILGNILAYLFMIPIMYRAIKIILSSGWFLLRTYAYSSSSMASSMQLRIYSWVINPLFSATFLIAAVEWFSDYKHKKVLMIMAIVDLIIITVTFGGRFNIVKFAIFFISAYFFLKSYSGKRERIKLKYIIIGFAVVALLIFLTSLRSLKGLSVVQNIFVYLFGSFVYFDLIITDGFSPLNAVKLYGNATFGIITGIPMYILYQFTGKNLTPEFLIDQASNVFLYISPNYRYNAFTTWLYPFWKDFGAIGMVVGVTFVVSLFCHFKKRLFRSTRMSTYILLIYITFVFLTSTLSYNMITIQHAITLILSVFLTRKAHRIGEINDEY